MFVDDVEDRTRLPYYRHLALPHDMILVILTICCFWLQVVESWPYSEQDHWPDQCQIADTQSPINIDRLQVQYDSSLATPFRCNYLTVTDYMFQGTVLHTEHSLQLILDQTENFTCNGIPFSDGSVYRLSYLELHWSQTDSSHGSEHAINGEYGDAELQMVHFNTNYGSYSQASAKTDGLFAISIMFSQSTKSDQSDNIVGNDALYDLASKTNSSTASLSALDLLQSTGLQHSKSHHFFTYRGSLTSPPCSQGVQWIVPESKAFVELPTLILLRALTINDGQSIGPNIRNLQQLGDRNVFASWDHAKQADDHAELLMLIVSLVGAGIVLIATGILVWMKFKKGPEYKDVGDSRYSM